MAYLSLFLRLASLLVTDQGCVYHWFDQQTTTEDLLPHLKTLSDPTQSSTARLFDDNVEYQDAKPNSVQSLFQFQTSVNKLWSAAQSSDDQPVIKPPPGDSPIRQRLLVLVIGCLIRFVRLKGVYFGPFHPTPESADRYLEFTMTPTEGECVFSDLRGVL